MKGWTGRSEGDERSEERSGQKTKCDDLHLADVSGRFQHVLDGTHHLHASGGNKTAKRTRTHLLDDFARVGWQPSRPKFCPNLLVASCQTAYTREKDDKIIFFSFVVLDKKFWCLDKMVTRSQTKFSETRAV